MAPNPEQQHNIYHLLQALLVMEYGDRLAGETLEALKTVPRWADEMKAKGIYDPPEPPRLPVNRG